MNNFSLDKVINELNKTSFASAALKVFRYQAKNNSIYSNYISSLNVNLNTIKDVNQIPFLPIRFFKQFLIKTGEWEHKRLYESSGTTDILSRSKHAVYDENAYLNLSLASFEKFYGPIEDYVVLGLLPSYLERDNSSLIAMTDYFIKKSGHDKSGFYLNEFDQIIKIIENEDRSKILLLGVTFALLELSDKWPQNLVRENMIVMETGGMKGRGKELTRQELHKILSDSFNTENIHAEYGMTELLSQAYSSGKGKYFPSSTMKVLVREMNDPLAVHYSMERSGCLNIIDLANANTCSFIETEDIGKVYEDGTFEVMGRMDNAELRGCSMLVI